VYKSGFCGKYSSLPHHRLLGVLPSATHSSFSSLSPSPKLRHSLHTAHPQPERRPKGSRHSPLLLAGRSAGMLDTHWEPSPLLSAPAMPRTNSSQPLPAQLSLLTKSPGREKRALLLRGKTPSSRDTSGSPACSWHQLSEIWRRVAGPCVLSRGDWVLPNLVFNDHCDVVQSSDYVGPSPVI
jgi:hypothetical protein